MIHPKSHVHRSVGSGEDFRGFYRIWARWPYWSCDLDSLNIFLFPPTLKATYENGYNWLSGL